MGHFASCPGQLKEEHALGGRKGHPSASHIYYAFPKTIGSLPPPHSPALQTGWLTEGSRFAKTARNQVQTSLDRHRLSLGLPPPLPYSRGTRAYRTDTARNRLRAERGSRDGPTCTYRDSTLAAHSSLYTQPQRSFNHTLRNFSVVLHINH